MADAGLKKAEKQLKDFALAFPEATEDFPWGHRAIKIKGKVFVFLYLDEEHLSMSAKLPHSCTAALELPFTSPTGYGLAKSGWISSRFEPGKKPPVELLCTWIEESFRAVAPKRLLAAYDASRQSGAPKPARAAAKKSAPKAAAKATAKKTAPKTVKKKRA